MIASLPPDALRAAAPEWLASHVSDAAAAERATRVLREVLAEASDADLETLREAFAAAGAEYRFYPANPLARRVSRAYLPAILSGMSVSGLEHLDAFLSGGPARRLLVGNHRSYVDTQLTDAVLVACGRAAVADRVVAIAGPKVYTDAFRRIAAIGLNTRKTAQSSAVATEQDSLTPRQLAAVALETLADCERLMDAGYLPLLYPEGTRTRTRRLQPFLRAAARYLAIPGARVLPVALTGADDAFPLGAAQLGPARVHLAFGAPFEAAELPGRTGALAEAHARIAALLPPAAQPEPDAPAVG